ncbi:MAG: dynamin family protein [Pseudomonadales bacterium]|nr:dynamin family protein [Pseudomonadales bacterium]
MDSSRLARQVDAYIRWRKDILQQLMRYRGWLVANRLQSSEMDERLNIAFEMLKEDRIILAFVGEFSRGKTELINALFFAHFGTRVLPSGGGRTTMCPTELFFDPNNDKSYIRLLPIETRLGSSGLASFRKIPDNWVYVPIDQDNPEMMKKAFSEVASVKKVSREDAAAMGFQVNILESVEDDSDKVYIPAWRHAMISFRHPLLEQGLTIIDTPGLNALGCEPELTFSLLPEAHAILLLLSASTGVSSTDLEIWNRHIRDLNLQENTGVYAILNKVDSIWDELEADAYNRQIIREMQSQCARLLSIAPDEIITVSAKEGLLAQIEGNDKRLAQSNLPALEKLLSNDVIRRKELMVKNRVVKDILTMLHGSRKMILRRKESLLEQQSILKGDVKNHASQLSSLSDQSKAEQAFYHKKLILLKSSRKAINREGSAMLSHVDKEKLEQYRKTAGQALSTSWTVVGMNNAMDSFFDSIRTDMTAFSDAKDGAQRLIAEVYANYESEQGLAPIDYPRFDNKAYIVKLDDLRNKSGSFRRNLKKMLTEQKSTSKRFFTTIATEISNIYLRLRMDGITWLNDVLLPIFQNAQQQKKMLDDQVLKLRAISNDGNDAKGKIDQINQMLDDINTQLKQADDILNMLRKPAPVDIVKLEQKKPPTLNAFENKARF